jgi:cobalt-zinc-cadmium efflux system outer membrane protein
MTSIKTLTIPAVLFLGLTAAASSAEPDAHSREVEAARDPQLTLGEVVDAALARDPDYPVLQAREDEARALSRLGKSLLGGEPAMFLRLEGDRASSSYEYREWEGGVELPLWRWNERAASRRLAAEAASGVRAEAELLRLKVAGEVREAVWETALTESSLELAKSNLETARALEAQVAQRVARGDLAQTDLLLARDETLQREVELQEAELNLRHRLLAYQRLTGLDALPLSITEVATTTQGTVDTNPYSVAPAAKVALSRARLEQTREESGGNPVLFVGGKRVDVGLGDTLDTMEASITFPFGTSRSRAQQAQAAVEVAESEANLTRAQRELERIQHEATHELEAARLSLSLAEERARLAEKRSAAYTRGFELGELTLSELLRERRRALAAIHEAKQRKLELERQIARYNQTRGIIP